MVQSFSVVYHIFAQSNEAQLSDWSENVVIGTLVSTMTNKEMHWYFAKFQSLNWSRIVKLVFSNFDESLSYLPLKYMVNRIYVFVCWKSLDSLVQLTAIFKRRIWHDKSLLFYQSQLQSSKPQNSIPKRHPAD